MLNNASGYKKIYIACGYTDLRQGIDGLAATIRQTLEIDPFQKNVLFMFCGRKPDKIKCLEWEGDGFVLVYKRLLDGSLLSKSQPQIGTIHSNFTFQLNGMKKLNARRKSRRRQQKIFSADQILLTT